MSDTSHFIGLEAAEAEGQGPEAVERVARALYMQNRFPGGCTWEVLCKRPDLRQHWIATARAAIAAYLQT